MAGDGVTGNRAARRAAAKRKGTAIASGGALLAGGLSALAAGDAHAEPEGLITVTDAGIGSGAGTLRWAVGQANADPDLSYIRFDLPPSSTITLAGTMTIAESLVIQGPGRDELTISGGGDHQIFYVKNDERTIEATISGVALERGYGGPGGAVQSIGVDVVLADVSLADNVATAGGGAVNISNADLVIRDSEVTGNTASWGGAVYSSGASRVALYDSTFVENTASTSTGGAVDVSLATYGTLAVRRSTLRQNTASGAGGAIRVSGASSSTTIEASYLYGNRSTADVGGAVRLGQAGASLSIDRSTIAANTAERGGGVSNVGVLSVTNSTIDGNGATTVGGGVDSSGTTTVTSATITGNTAGSAGGGLASSGVTTVNSTILSENAAGTRPDIQAGVLTLGYSLVSDTSGTTITSATGPGLLLGVDAELDPLGWTRYAPTPLRRIGEYTPTAVFDAGDPAITAGVDQRGLPRVTSGRADMGAYEANADEDGEDARRTVMVTNDDDGGPGSLRSALSSAAGWGGTTLIELDPSVEELTLTTGPLFVRNAGSVRLYGDGLTIDADGLRQAVDVTFVHDDDVPNRRTTLADVTLTGGDALEGGAIRADAGVYVERSVITGNVAVDGGAVRITGYGELVLYATTVSGNVATANGGAVLADEYAVVELSYATLSGNSAEAGGAIDIKGDETLLSVSRSTIAENTAAEAGSAIRVDRGRAFFDYSTIADNSGATAVTVTDGTFALYGVVIADTDGGADLALESTSFQPYFSLVETYGDDVVLTDDGNQGGVDPKLWPLGDNGGSTETMLPGETSPLVDGGDPGRDPEDWDGELDQRGRDRLAGDVVDIGSVERQADDIPGDPEGSDSSTTTTSSTSTTTVVVPDDGDGGGGGGGGSRRDAPTIADEDDRFSPPELSDDEVVVRPDRRVEGELGDAVSLPPADEDVEVAFQTDDGEVSVIVRNRADGDGTTITISEIDADDTGERPGFRLLDRAYEVDVDGAGEDGGIVCLPFDPDEVADAGWSEDALQLFHFSADGTREVITTSIDRENNRVCGAVSSFSPFAVGTLATRRLAGSDAARTAARISRAAFPATTPVVYLTARGADGLAAGTAAAVEGGPVLFVERDRVPVATRIELERLAPGLIVVVGGDRVVSDELVDRLNAVRMGGVDRYDTAARVATSTWTAAPAVYVASGESAADALVAGAAAAAEGAPLLLVAPDSVPDSTGAALEQLRPSRIVVVGGTAAVSDEVLRSLGTGAQRLAGADRYATAAAMARAAGTTRLFITRGDVPVDAVGGIPAAVATGAALLLVEPDAIPASVWEALDAVDPSAITVLGGTAAVSLPVEIDLAVLLG